MNALVLLKLEKLMSCMTLNFIHDAQQHVQNRDKLCC